jgi:hypothetical protein
MSQRRGRGVIRNILVTKTRRLPDPTVRSLSGQVKLCSHCDGHFVSGSKDDESHSADCVFSRGAGNVGSDN